jgi:hypothetical protein
MSQVSQVHVTSLAGCAQNSWKVIWLPGKRLHNYRELADL